jgi:RNA polymerase sigma factor (TIGR02999 family)
MPADAVPQPPPGVRQRFPQLYGELRDVAARLLGRTEGRRETPSDLTHEAFAKLTGEEARRRNGARSELGDKPDSIFKACFGAACRDLLADQARRDRAERRGGARRQQTLHTEIPGIEGRSFDPMEIEDAMQALAAQDPVLAQIVELRVYGGLTIAECAATLDMSPRSLDRKWAFARAWLQSRLQ